MISIPVHSTQLSRLIPCMMLSLSMLLCAGTAFPEGASKVRAEQLRCEAMNAPLAVDSVTPVLSWNLMARDRNVRQSAFQVVVASTEARLEEEDGDLWNSGRVETAAQRADYRGAALTPGQAAYWKVRVWDGAGAVSAWSEASEWGAGIPAEAWQARWIVGGEKPLPLFRKSFSLSKPLRRATAYVCGLGQFELSVNGAKAGEHVLDPGWTNYKKTCLYVPFDLSETLQTGENVLGVMLGNGMYNVKGGRYVKFLGSFGAPKVTLELHLEYEDGSVERVLSDATWKTAPGPVTFSCIYGGEDYDARLEIPGWNAPGFNDSSWALAQETDGPGGQLRPQTAPPLKVIDRRKPASIVRLENGKYEVDLGLNLSAIPYLRVSGRAGDRVTIETAERKNTLWEGHSYTYTLKGEGEEVFVPRFTYFGFQYLYVSGVDWGRDVDPQSRLPELLEVGADFISSSAPPAGAFECGYPLFNEINTMVANSVRSNLQSVLTDCPHREKLGWLEVSHLMGPSILYHYDAGNLYRKICRDTTEAQLENGMVPDIAPEYHRFSGGFFESAEWGSACVQLPWLLYQWHGDATVLERQYDTMARYTRYLAGTRDAKGLAKGGLGDWYDWTPEKGHAGEAQLTPNQLPATCMLFDNARILAETAALLGGRDADAQEFRTLAEQVKANFMAAYYQAGEKTVSTGSQAALSMALYFGLVPKEDRFRVLERLVADLESKEWKQSTGEVSFRYMLQALAQNGRSDVIYRVIDRTDAPGYGCMLKQYGLQTLSECWDKPGSSLNHCMFGHIQEWFQGHVLGIRQAPDSVGFERLWLAPVVAGRLPWAEGHFDSPRGRIEVRWEKTDKGLRYKAVIPANTTAEVVLPAGPNTSVTESGTGVDDLEFREDGIHLRVGSGSYEWETARL